MARRARERADRLQRQAENYERGAQGERATAAVLAKLPPEWTVLHDVRWPGRPRANIDHVVIGPGGVFVVDTKNWNGRISLNEGALRQNGRAREQTVSSAGEAGVAIAWLVGEVAEHTRAVLCFVGESGLSGWSRDVMICSTDNLLVMLTSRPAVLNPPSVRSAARRLDSVLHPASTSSSATTARSQRPARPRQAPVRSRKTGPSLGRLVLGVLLAIGLATIGPQVLPQVADWVAEVIVDQAASP